MRKEEENKVLVVDDDPRICWMLNEALKDEGYQVFTARDGQSALQIALKENPQVMVLDIKLPDISGLEVLERLRQAELRVEVIILSAHGETKNVVKAIKLGAADFVNKPFDIEEVKMHIRNTLEKGRLKKEVQFLRSELKAKNKFESFIGDSPQIIEIKKLIEEVADSGLTVLIRGESGTGKEIIARILHHISSRRSGPFIKVNCAAIPKELLEAELFGYERGAFTGAYKRKPGRFELANQGTIFLDEIGDMPIELQAKLLQILEHREFVRVGGVETISVDVRIICATNQDLEKNLAEGTMREDLYYRLNEITIPIPPLRERREDIPLLIEHFINIYNKQFNRQFPPLSPSTLQAIEEYDWPGNVRELENLIKQTIVRGDEGIIKSELKKRSSLSSSSPSPPQTTEDELSLKKASQKAIEETEKNLISKALNQTNWNRRKASQLLGISYRSLLYKIKEYGLGT